MVSAENIAIVMNNRLAKTDKQADKSFEEFGSHGPADDRISDLTMFANHMSQHIVHGVPNESSSSSPESLAAAIAIPSAVGLFDYDDDYDDLCGR
jgi:hypothetical protein